jgi:hypothetical protein
LSRVPGLMGAEGSPFAFDAPIGYQEVLEGKKNFCFVLFLEQTEKHPCEFAAEI